MLGISVSIVNFNTKDNLRRCLDSIRENIKGISYEIIVADNNSQDGSVQMLAQDYSEVKVIVNKDNLGVTKAKNQTFRTAQGRYILILDSDIEILDNAVNAMYNFMENNPNVGILGPRVLFPDLKPQHSCNKSAPACSVYLSISFSFFPVSATVSIKAESARRI